MKAPDVIYLHKIRDEESSGYYSQWFDSRARCVPSEEYLRKDIVDEKIKTAEETIELAEDHAYLAGAVNEREKMMKEAVEGEITKDNRGNNVVRAGVFNKDFEYGDKVRVIVLPKED